MSTTDTTTDSLVAELVAALKGLLPHATNPDYTVAVSELPIPPWRARDKAHAAIARAEQVTHG